MEKPPVDVDAAQNTNPMLVAPHGIENIVRFFGDIREHIGPDGKLAASWQMNYLARRACRFRFDWHGILRGPSLRWPVIGV